MKKKEKTIKKICARKKEKRKTLYKRTARYKMA